MSKLSAFLQTLPQAAYPVGLLTYHHVALLSVENIHWVKMSNDPQVYAHDLYRTLRDLDQRGLKHIIIECVPETVDWEAIRDRLNKATAKRV